MLELVVALLILSLMASMATLAVNSLRRPDASSDSIRAEARARAIREATPVTIVLDSLPGHAGPTILLFWPDGSVVGE